MISLKNVSKKFTVGTEEVLALSNINLQIKEGEFVVIVGPSGSGKSTLLHLIAGLDSPSTGTITISNTNLKNYNDKKISSYRNKSVGMIFQDFKLHPNLTIEENTQIPLMFDQRKKFKKSTAIKKAKEILAELGLQQRLHHKPSQISGGQKQRAAIARALIMNPKIILADEPTGNLDSQTGHEIINLLKQSHQKRKNILIVVTHDANIAKHASRIIEIKDGMLKEKNNFKKFMH
jgi:putative ABC transport system ATP-binding protein